MDRIFTNYSGDASGRFLELASLTRTPGRSSPAALAPLLGTIARHQKADGHFGVDLDLSKPMPKGAPPIPMLWGNARLLVGLLAASQEFHDESLLAAARRLGDFYVNSADQLCTPAREADYRSSGSGGDGYMCCYFPAIEGLVSLHRATGEARYLKQAERMAEFFARFDVLPVEHSHGNLCAWRGILMLYDVTRERKYLERARAKWTAAMLGGFVWPLGGVGEHWYVSFNGDEGCSESDWLRFNLDLWRFTGEVCYLEMAERLLRNQYLMNQCPNGGFGMCHVDGDSAGPIGTDGMLDEWPFCCSFHGPLGLHFLKGYLATGSQRGVFVDFPFDFTAPVHAAQRDWLVKVQSKCEASKNRTILEIEMAPQGGDASAATTLWVRVPQWTTSQRVTSGDGKILKAAGGYVGIERTFAADEKVTLEFQTALAVEGRRFERLRVAPGKVSRLRDVALLSGPDLMFAAPVAAAGRPVLLATIDGAGRLSFPACADGGYATVALPNIDADNAAISRSLVSGSPVFVRRWSGMFSHRRSTLMCRYVVAMSDFNNAALAPPRRSAFQFDLVVVPADSIATGVGPLGERARQSASRLTGPFFGENLEKQPEAWLSRPGWEFTAQGLRVAGGDVGLLDGDDYRDYRLEFDLVLPKEGKGMAGWLVRAKDADNLLMFQLQTADSPLDLPQYKTRPNTLRPHVRREGKWQVLEPVALPKEVRRGETHHIAVECRRGTVEVFLDGQSIHRAVHDFEGGTVGFRASGPDELGLYRHISLRRLK